MAKLEHDIKEKEQEFKQLQEASLKLSAEHQREHERLTTVMEDKEALLARQHTEQASMEANYDRQLEGAVDEIRTLKQRLSDEQEARGELMNQKKSIEEELLDLKTRMTQKMLETEDRLTGIKQLILDLFKLDNPSIEDSLVKVKSAMDEHSQSSLSAQAQNEKLSEQLQVLKQDAISLAQLYEETKKNFTQDCDAFQLQIRAKEILVKDLEGSVASKETNLAGLEQRLRESDNSTASYENAIDALLVKSGQKHTGDRLKALESFATSMSSAVLEQRLTLMEKSFTHEKVTPVFVGFLS